MKKNYIFIILTWSFLSFAVYPQTDYELIMQQIRQENSSGITDIASLDNTVTSLLSTLNKDGSWPDIDYTERAFTNWKPVAHLDRLLNMANAYTSPGSDYYQVENLHSAIRSALAFWDESDPGSDNWWYNEIACPQRLGLLLIVLRDGDLPTESTLESSLIVQMNRGDPKRQAGANKLDIALHYIYRGCLIADSQVLQTGVDESFYPLTLTTQEGVQHDYSYQQHGPQLYISGYGTVFVNTTVKVAVYLTGTSYALSGPKLDILTDFVFRTYTGVIRGQYMDFSVNGRSISRKDNLLSRGFAGTLEKLRDIDPAHTSEYNNIIARLKGEEGPGYQVAESHTQYWRSDYALYNSPGYSFSVRTASARTSKTENGNGENLKGYFLSDGATNIRVDGDEYYNIFPVWEWNKIPGITAPELATIPLRRQWQVPGTCVFTGGVSNGSQGVKVFALDEYGVQAKKGWFFFGEEVVCLGAGISATAAEPILTTVNQALLDGSVTIAQNGTVTQPGQGTHIYDNAADWVLHGKVAYFFPEKGKLTVRNQTQTGSWGSINNSYSSDPVSEDVFAMWIDHGTLPSGASYAYIVVPNRKTQAEVEAYDTSSVNIIRNDQDIQAVRHEALGILQLAFYAAGTFEHDSVKITVDKPCVLILKDIESPEVTVHMADPGQRQSLINVYTDLPGIEKTRHSACEMPSGEYAGASKSFTINNETPEYVPKPGTQVGIIPVDDAYVRDGTYADTNYGTAPVLVVKKDGSSYARETFLKFDLGQIDGNIIDATLKLYVSSANTNVASSRWELKYVEDDTWNENSIRWNNKPATGEVIASIPGQPLGAAEWNLSQKVTEELGKDGVLSLQVSSTVAGSTTDVVFHSKETANSALRPKLTVRVNKCSVNPVTATITGDNKVYTGYKDAHCTTLSAMASGGTGNYTYLWNTGETNRDIHPCIDETTTFTVTVTDEAGCSSGTDFTVYTENIAEKNNENDTARIVLCYKGQTIYIAKSRAGDLLNKGAALGKCDPENTPETSGFVLKYASPNPTTGPVNIHIANTHNGIDTHLLVFDGNGQCILRQSIRINKGLNTCSIDLSHKNPGVYFIKMPGVYHENNALKIIKL